MFPSDSPSTSSSGLSPVYASLGGLRRLATTGPPCKAFPDQSLPGSRNLLRDGCPCPDVLGFKAAHRLIERFTSFIHHRVGMRREG